ncbi:MAG: Flp pilus assembly protein CpaB [Xanthobacteraceae bacterium]|nr:Flp pilus assembly protein CpaB [Xanthobacteraceae bacterium]
MRASTIVMIAAAVVFGVLAVFFAQTWLSRQADLRAKNFEAQKKTVATRNVVVAKSPLRFGMPLTPQVLREVAWPEGAIPAGAFTSIETLLADGKRAVLASIEPNEPVISSKLTGAGQKATLSAVIQDGMKAVTVRVNDVEGVAGFVLPGDRVDVLVTRQAEKGSGSNDVVLQNVKVLAVDQIADDRVDKPTLVKAVTLEVDTVAAQKLALAASVGSLALVLRKAGDPNEENSRRITLIDIGSGSMGTATQSRTQATIVVYRAEKKEEYSVPVEGTDRR